MTLHEEWKPTPFNGGAAYAYELCVLLLPVVLGLSKRRPSLVELGLAVLWLHFAADRLPLSADLGPDRRAPDGCVSVTRFRGCDAVQQASDFSRAIELVCQARRAGALGRVECCFRYFVFGGSH